MARPNITAIRFHPPVVIARLGNSPHPLEAFTWAEDSRPFGGGKTVIVPRKSFRVLADGSLEEYTPKVIRFKDDGAIRPVCPFLELEAKVDGRDDYDPLTGTLLDEAGLMLSNLSFKVVAANLKAQFRTGDEACGFEARAWVRGNDHSPKRLLAWSHAQSGNLLVLPERPVSLGSFQVMRPHASEDCLDRIRIRFTPAQGEVYGPPISHRSKAIGSRHYYRIVKEANQILNPMASWTAYDYLKPPHLTPEPGNIYDGEDDLDRNNTSWGIIDDTCDVLITATLATPTGAPQDRGRVLVGPPDFAPDRRPFYSLVDDLADRDPASLGVPLRKCEEQEQLNAVSDLFRRIAETASLINVEAARASAVSDNDGEARGQHFPVIDKRMMTKADKLLSARAQIETTAPAGKGANDAQMLPLAEYAKLRHLELGQPALLQSFLLGNEKRLLQILRPPFALTSKLKRRPAEQTPEEPRDPRIPRSYAFDMRMPPFMSDGDYAPLSLTRFQWELLWSLVKLLNKEPKQKAATGP